MFGLSWTRQEDAEFQRSSARGGPQALRRALLLTLVLIAPLRAVAVPADSAAVYSARAGILAGHHAAASGSGFARPPELRLIQASLSDFDRADAVRRTDWSEPLLHTMAWQMAGMALLLSLDRDVTGFKPVRFQNVINGLTAAPVWDTDGWVTNYIGHPIWGSETYLSARRQGSTPLESFIFSTASSVFWEYGIEGWAEHPSIQDLVFTSTLGSVVGELRYRALKSLVRSDTPWARPLMTIVDPFSGLSNVLGIRIRMGLSIIQ